MKSSLPLLSGGALLLALLAGCASPGLLPTPTAALEPAQLGLADARLPALDERWWRLWGDDRLEALVERALTSHPRLQAQDARRLRAQAAIGSAEAQDDVQLALNADAMRQRYTAHGLVPPPVAGSVRNTATVQIGAGIELDFFGRHRAALQAAIGAERAAAADIAATRSWLTAQVVHSHVQLARWLAQRRVTERQLAQRTEMLALVRQRVEAGLDSQVELQQNAAALPDTRGQLAALDEQIMLARHQLAALTAQPPQALDAYAPDLALPAGLPAAQGASLDLLGRRADLVAARWRVEAATQDVAEARTRFYPDLSLNAFAGFSALGLDQLVDLGSRQYGIGPALRLPLFESGRLRAQLRGKAADLDAAVAAYNSALLDAVQESADAAGTLQSLQRQRQEQAAAQTHAELALDHARQRHQNGLGGQLPALQAETLVLAQQRAAIDLLARELDGRVRLIQALGGGWPGEQRPAAGSN